MTDKILHMDVRFKRGSFKVDANLSASSGVTALFGRSGSGKSTIVSLLAGLLTPQDGLVQIGDKILYGSTKGINVPVHKRNVGYVFQDPRLFPHLTVTQNLTYGSPRLPAAEHAKIFAQVVYVLSLESLLSRWPLSLSGGEKQRVAIGRALLSNPKILLMDEPLANLDNAHKKEILPYIQHINTTFNVPVVYVSHAIDEVVCLADTLALVNDGSIAAHGPVEDIMGRLDLSPLTGRYEAGAVLNLSVANHDKENGLTHLSLQGHRLYAPQTHLRLGTKVRLRLRARDIALALSAPKDTSILNQLPVVVTDINLENGPHVELALAIQSKPGSEYAKPQTLVARITKKSFQDLGLAKGKSAHALIKAVAIDHHSLSNRGIPHKRDPL
ncbi:MAG: molybdenum ABC transporter ATP-binding protein [Magnetovibrio sp.]|nr:molybdenum ABC transporter ATP-binding protein [Magnetovibrio sp.]